MGRLEPCDRGLPNSVQGWANTFLNYIDIPLARGLFEVFNHEGLSTKSELPIRNFYLQKIELTDKDYTDIIPHAEERLLTAFTEIYHNNLVSLNSRELSYKELTQLFIHEYREQGHDYPTLAEASIERFVYTNRKHNPQSFIVAVMKPMKKLSFRNTQ